MSRNGRSERESLKIPGYRIVESLGQGTFSKVWKAEHLKSGEKVAIKVMKNEFSSMEQVDRLREIQALKRLKKHPNIIQLKEVLFDEKTGRLALVFELMAVNLYEYISDRKKKLRESKIRGFIYQLIKSIDHMHSCGIFHRDIKPENILLNRNLLKLADFGSCKGSYSKQPFTEYISTRWYRAPECLLTDGYYDSKMDVWGCGCVMYEVITFQPLFPGEDELDQAKQIHKILGTPSKKVLEKFKRFAHNTNISFNFPYQRGKGMRKLLPKEKKDTVDLLRKLLIYDPDKRITAKQALKHPYFREIREKQRKSTHALQRYSDMYKPGGSGRGSGSGEEQQLLLGNMGKGGACKKRWSVVPHLHVEVPTKKKKEASSSMLPDLVSYRDMKNHAHGHGAKKKKKKLGPLGALVVEENIHGGSMVPLIKKKKKKKKKKKRNIKYLSPHGGHRHLHHKNNPKKNSLVLPSVYTKFANLKRKSDFGGYCNNMIKLNKYRTKVAAGIKKRAFKNHPNSSAMLVEKWNYMM